MIMKFLRWIYYSMVYKCIECNSRAVGYDEQLADAYHSSTDEYYCFKHWLMVDNLL